jgi:hypothetical protein
VGAEQPCNEAEQPTDEAEQPSNEASLFERREDNEIQALIRKCEFAFQFRSSIRLALELSLSLHMAELLGLVGGAFSLLAVSTSISVGRRWQTAAQSLVAVIVPTDRVGPLLRVWRYSGFGAAVLLLFAFPGALKFMARIDSVLEGDVDVDAFKTSLTGDFSMLAVAVSASFTFLKHSMPIFYPGRVMPNK